MIGDLNCLFQQKWLTVVARFDGGWVGDVEAEIKAVNAEY